MNTNPLTVNFKDKSTGRIRHIPVKVLRKPRNETEYTRFEKILDCLIDQVQGSENHPLTILLEIIGDNLEQYDNENNPAIGEDLNEQEIVEYLMQEHKLRQKDLADIFGGQANVSKFLSGERPLSKSQIAGLKTRFGVSAELFFR